MTLSIILGFLFGFLLGLAAALLLTVIAVHREKARYKTILQDIELWKCLMEDGKHFMENTAPKKHSPKPESPYRWQQL